MNIIASLVVAVIGSIWALLLGWMILAPLVNQLEKIADFLTSFEVTIEKEDEDD